MMAMVFVWTLQSVFQAIFLGILLIAGIIFGLFFVLMILVDRFKFKKHKRLRNNKIGLDHLIKK